MRKGLRSLISLTLVAVMSLPGAAAFGADNSRASALQKYTEAEVAEMTCSSENAPDGKHVLAGRSSLVVLNGRYVRASMNRKEYEETCTYSAGKSEDRACRYCNTWFTIAEGHDKKATPSHKYGEEKVVASSCDGATYTMKICSECGYVEVTVEGTQDNSKHTQETTVKEATCTTDGITVTKCSVCDAVLSCDVTPAKGHNIYASTVKNPKCFEEGASKISCTQCGYSRTESIPKVGRHTEGTSYSTKPTCTEPGKATKKCSLCGEIISEETEVPALGHDYQPVTSTDHPCTEPTGLYKCTRCGEIKENQETVIPGHKFGNVIVVKATCKQGGYSYKECSVCGEKEIVPGSETEKTDHNLDTANTHVVEPTCGADGYSYQICTVCGEKVTVAGSEKSATGQHKMGIWTNYTPPTCSSAGHYNKKCSTCGYVDPTEYTEPATGNHFYNNGDYSSCESEKVCIKCGYVAKAAKPHQLGNPVQSSSAGKHTRKCTVKGCKYTVEEDCVGVDDHNCTTDVVCECGRVMTPGKASHTVTDQYSFDENTHFIVCADPDCSVIVKAAEAHTYGAKDTPQEFTCTVCGYEKKGAHTHDYEWKSDEAGHWQECTICHVEKDRSSHDKEASDGYDGTCSKAVTCSICGYAVLPANTTHDLYTAEWEVNNEYHYHVCMRKGCEETEAFEHVALSDGDCTTPDVCSVCGHEVTAASEGHSWVVAEDGHTEQGHRRVCSVPGCKAESIAEHEAGTKATCKEKAECKYCHQHYGELDKTNHVGGTEIRNDKAATEEEEGYTGDTYCLGCNALLEKGETLPKIDKEHVHTFDKYIYDKTGHYKVCSECEEKENDVQTPHTMSEYVNDTANGNHYRECEVCGYKEIGSHEHEAENYDCTQPLCCKDCGAVVVEACETHNFSGRVTSVDDGHVTACINRNCKVTSPVAPHSGGMATCTNGAHCEVCGEEYTVSNPNNHAGGTELRNQKNATKEEEGYTGDVYCLGCDKVITKGEVIEKLPEDHEHVFGDWISDTVHHWKSCECGDIAEKAEHTYKNGSCTVCGAVDPDYNNIDMLIDEEHGISATPEDNSGAYHGIQLVVDTITEAMPELYAQVEASVGKVFATYLPLDIKLIDTESGETVDAKGKLTVKVPVPSGWLASDTKVYYVNADGMTALATTPLEDGAYVTFTAEHFSVYVLVNVASKLETHEHKYGDWKSDATYHWKECECGEIADKAEHTYENGKCTVCNAADPNYSTATEQKDTTKPADVTNPDDTTNVETQDKTDSPKTGDESGVAWLLALGMISLCGMCMIFGKKKYRG